MAAVWSRGGGVCCLLSVFLWRRDRALGTSQVHRRVMMLYDVGVAETLIADLRAAHHTHWAIYYVLHETRNCFQNIECICAICEHFLNN